MSAQARFETPKWWDELSKKADRIYKTMPHAIRPFVVFPLVFLLRVLCIPAALIILVYIAKKGGVAVALDVFLTTSCTLFYWVCFPSLFQEADETPPADSFCESFAVQSRLHLSVDNLHEATEQLAEKERNLRKQDSLASAILQEQQRFLEDERPLFLASLRNLSNLHHNVVGLELAQIEVVNAYLKRLFIEHRAKPQPSLEDEVLNSSRALFPLTLLERQAAGYGEVTTIAAVCLFVLLFVYAATPYAFFDTADIVLASLEAPSLSDFLQRKFIPDTHPSEAEILAKGLFADYLNALGQHHVLGLLIPTYHLSQPYLDLVEAERANDEAEETVQAAVLDAVIVRSEVKRLFQLARREKED